MKLTLAAIAVAAGATSALAHDDHTFAAGAPATGGSPGRPVTIKMSEQGGHMSFEPATLDIKAGETIDFTIVNAGKGRHEFRLDSLAGNADHKAMMRRMPGMAHRDANALTLAPGATATLAWHFTKPGTYEFACLIPGHYEAGMHGRVVVAK